MQSSLKALGMQIGANVDLLGGVVCNNQNESKRINQVENQAHDPHSDSDCNCDKRDNIFEPQNSHNNRRNRYICTGCYGICCAQCVDDIHLGDCPSKTVRKIRNITATTISRVKDSISQLKDIENKFESLRGFVKPLFEHWGVDITQSVSLRIAELQSELIDIDKCSKSLQFCSQRQAIVYIPRVMNIEELETQIEQLRETAQAEIDQQLHTIVRNQLEITQKCEFPSIMPSAAHFAPQPVVNWLLDFQQKCIFAEPLSTIKREREQLQQERDLIKQELKQFKSEANNTIMTLTKQLSEYCLPIIVFPYPTRKYYPIYNGDRQTNFSYIYIQSDNNQMFHLSIIDFTSNRQQFEANNKQFYCNFMGPEVYINQFMIDGQTEWNQFAIVQNNMDYITKKDPKYRADYAKLVPIDKPKIQIGKFIYHMPGEFLIRELAPMADE